MCTILHGSFCKRRRWWCIASKRSDKININSKVTRRVGIPWLDHVPINVVWGLCHKAIHLSNNGLCIGKIPMFPIDASIDMWTTYFKVYKSCTSSSIARLLVEVEEAQRNALCLIQVQDCLDIALGILNLPTLGPQFLEEVKNVQRRLIFKSIFSNCLLAGEAL